MQICCNIDPAFVLNLVTSLSSFLNISIVCVGRIVLYLLEFINSASNNSIELISVDL